MKHLNASLLALSAFFFVPALAQAAPHAPHWSAAGLVGFGFEDEANFGIGARVGYSLRNNIYLGGLFQYHFGETDEAGFAPVTAEWHANVYYFGFEGGYDFHIDDVVIRPYMGLGPGFTHWSQEGCTPFGCGDFSDTDTDFAFWMGGTALYQFRGSDWFIGGDFRLPIVDGDVYPSLFFTGGLNF